MVHVVSLVSCLRGNTRIIVPTDQTDLTDWVQAIHESRTANGSPTCRILANNSKKHWRHYRWLYCIYHRTLTRNEACYRRTGWLCQFVTYSRRNQPESSRATPLRPTITVARWHTYLKVVGSLRLIVPGRRHYFVIGFVTIRIFTVSR